MTAATPASSVPSLWERDRGCELMGVWARAQRYRCGALTALDERVLAGRCLPGGWSPSVAQQKLQHHRVEVRRIVTVHGVHRGPYLTISNDLRGEDAENTRGAALVNYEQHLAPDSPIPRRTTPASERRARRPQRQRATTPRSFIAPG